MGKSITVKQKPDEELIDGKRVHELAKLFPPMSDEEFAAVVEDVKTNGLIEPIVLLDGQILDGVHRLRACLEAGVRPAYRKWDGEGGTALQFVWSKNSSRRNLSAGQKAVIAVKAERDFAVLAKRRMSSSERKKLGVEKIPHLGDRGRARDAAGTWAGVNPHYVTDAKKLSVSRPDLLKEVWLGHLSLSSAMQRVNGADGALNEGQTTHKISIIFMGKRFRCDDQSEAKAKELADGFIERDIAVRLTDKRLKKASSMYPGTKTWNPFVGCRFDCWYCERSFKKQAKRRRRDCEKCYGYEPHEHGDRLSKIPDEETVFVCGNADISFCKTEFVCKIIDAIKRKNESNKRRKKPLQNFYMQSKCPASFKPILKDLPANVILLTTLETNRDKGYENISNAPSPTKRYRQFLGLKYPRKAVTVEPLLDFDVEEFANRIASVRPAHVYLGYNSHEAGTPLPEPPHRKVVALAEALLARGIEVRGKDLRGLPMPKGVIMPKTVSRGHGRQSTAAKPGE